MPSVPAGAFTYYGLRLMVAVTHILMVISGIMILVAGRDLQNPVGDKLASVGILGISIAVLQTLLNISYFWMTRTFSNDNPKFGTGSKWASLLQGLLLVLALIYLIVPSVHEGNEANQEIRAVRYASLVFLIFYGYVLFGLIKSGWMSEQTVPILNAGNSTETGPRSPVAAGFNSMN